MMASREESGLRSVEISSSESECDHEETPLQQRSGSDVRKPAEVHGGSISRLRHVQSILAKDVVNEARALLKESAPI